MKTLKEKREISNIKLKHQGIRVLEEWTVFELLAREDQALLVRRNTLLVLDLRLHILNAVRALDLEGDRLARQGLDEDLHRVGCVLWAVVVLVSVCA